MKLVSKQKRNGRKRMGNEKGEHLLELRHLALYRDVSFLEVLLVPRLKSQERLEMRHV